MSKEGCQSQCLFQDLDALLESSQEELDQLVNINKGRRRSKSSTRLDFLSFEDPFLTVSSSVHTDSNMSSNDNQNMVDLCKCNSGMTTSECCGKQLDHDGTS